MLKKYAPPNKYSHNKTRMYQILSVLSFKTIWEMYKTRQTHCNYLQEHTKNTWQKQKQKFLNIYLQGASSLQELTRTCWKNMPPPNKYSPGLNQCHVKEIMGERKMPLSKTFILNLYPTIVGLLVELLNCSYAFDNVNVEWVMVRLLLIVTVRVPDAHKGNSYVREKWPPNPHSPPQQISLLIQSIKVVIKYISYIYSCIFLVTNFVL